MKTLRIGVVMDPIENISIAKDTTFAMLLEMQKRNWEIFYMNQQDLFLQKGKALAQTHTLLVDENPDNWFCFKNKQTIALKDLHAILMRVDPPFNMNYIYTTYLLEQAEKEGVLVINKPQSLRDANEKLFTSWFPQCCPPTLVTSNKNLLRDFFNQYHDIILKPLDGMGGQNVFRITEDGLNLNVITEVLTQHGVNPIMAQSFIPEITAGDKRILVIHGKPVPYALVRIPALGEIRGNIAAGGTTKGQVLSKRDLWICEQVGPMLKAKGLYFVGLDVIGDYLTEINVTSPTCVRQLDELYHLNICAQLMDVIEKEILK